MNKIKLSLYVTWKGEKKGKEEFQNPSFYKGLKHKKESTLKPSFLTANMTSIIYWTRFSVSDSCRTFRNLSNTAWQKKYKLINHNASMYNFWNKLFTPWISKYETETYQPWQIKTSGQIFLPIYQSEPFFPFYSKPNCF